jgi:isopenicillin N synthase-like dioxygenase
MANSQTDAPVVANANANANLPIIDLGPFLHPSTSTSTADQRLQTARDLVRACRDVGFVYIKNHGVPQDELDEAFRISKTFYDLPTEQKMTAPHPPGWAVHRGYSWPGLEKVSDALGKKDDDGEEEEVVRQFREVQDFKVSTLCPSPSFLTSI